MTANDRDFRPDRRRWLGRCAALGLAGLLPGPGFAMHYLRRRAIPSSGETLPVVGLGTARSFDVGGGERQRQPLREVLRLFVEHGGALVDTSPMYGEAEAVVGDLVTGLGIHDRLFLATKVWTRGAGSGVAQMNESARLLRHPRLDLMQIHNLVDWRTHLRTLRAWKDEGRIRYIGVTHYHAGAFEQIESLLKTEALDFLQINYSLAEPQAERRLLPLAQDLGVAVIVNRPFARGSLFSRVRGVALPDWAQAFDCQSWAQLFLKYVLAHPAVTCPIPATSKPHHLVDNMGAGLGALPDPAQVQQIRELWRSLG